jgi:peptide/nickel transport system substrate-binding protein
LAREVREIWEDKFHLNIEIKTVPPERMLDEVIATRNFQILLYGQEVSRDPDRYVYWHSTQTEHPNMNLTGFKHVRADRALEEGRNETDFTERKIHYNEFQNVVDEQVPAIFLYHPYVKYYVSEYFEGIGDKYTFSLADRFLDFANWKRIETN